MRKFLLHVCCTPCASYVIEELKRHGFEVTAFFYNPNIYPESEYKIRRDEIKKYCQENRIEFVEFINHPVPTSSGRPSLKRRGDNLPLTPSLVRRGDYGHQAWIDELCRDEALPRLAKEPEGGERCNLCFRYRLNATAEYAVGHGYKYFDTTLSISPHKNYKKIKVIGDKLVQKYNLEFYGQDWKKQDGFKKACELSHQHNFYRQDYCGCEYSIKALNHQSIKAKV